MNFQQLIIYLILEHCTCFLCSSENSYSFLKIKNFITYVFLAYTVASYIAIVSYRKPAVIVKQGMHGFLTLLLSMNVCMSVCVCVCVCVHVCVCVSAPRLSLTYGPHNYDWLKKLYSFCRAAVVDMVSGHGLSIDVCHRNQLQPSI